MATPEQNTTSGFRDTSVARTGNDTRKRVALRAGGGLVAVWFTVLLLVTTWPPHAAARAARYPDGAPPGFTAGFQEQSCHACHFHAEVNAPPGQAAIEGVPQRYAAGERYSITVKLSRPNMKLAGFQLAVRATDTGAQAGTLASRPDSADAIRIDTQAGVQYANQRTQGSAPDKNGVAQWTVIWTAPERNVPVVFHVAANAADGDGTAEGDHVYVAVAESVPAGVWRH